MRSKLALVAALLLLVGCDSLVSTHVFDEAVEKCEINGGLKYLHVNHKVISIFPDKAFARCINGAEFRLSKPGVYTDDG